MSFLKRHDQTPRHPAFGMADLAQAREMFWQNVTREMLTSLAMQRAKLANKAEAVRREMEAKGEDPGELEHLPGFDGRVAIVTKIGERIPIADITPLFACSIGGTSRERALSEDVQCTVFQIRTPTGEVYTFPIHEIRGLHALTEEAMQTLQEEAAGESGNISGAPFGFAAFTSLAREFEAEELDALESDTEDDSQSE